MLAKKRIEIGEDGDARAIRTLDDQFPVANRVPGLEELGHRRLRRQQRLAVGRKNVMGSAKPAFPVTDVRSMAPQLGGAPIGRDTPRFP
jgi:hypothetical protein